MDLVHSRLLPLALTGPPVLSEQPVPQESVDQLTGRELEVFQLTAEGLTNAEIGKKLFLSEETIKTHLRHLLAKLHARSRAHAVAVGFRFRLIS